MHSSNWQSLFVGREEELKELINDYQEVKQNSPLIRVIIGETGLGKTRLIQEFYNYLSENEDGKDPEGYWPDFLGRDGNSLNVNPSFEERDLSENPAYLWWGLRFTNPNFRNKGESNGGIQASLSQLRPHIIHIFREKEKQKESYNSFKNLIKASFGIASLAAFGGIPQLIVDAVTGIGIVDDFLDGKNAASKINSLSPKELHQKEESENLQKILRFFEELLKQIPVVIVVDDAQWAYLDEETLSFLEKLYNYAKTNALPLYILATHWKQEWQCGLEEIQEDTSPTPLSFAHLYSRTTTMLSELELKALQKEKTQTIIQKAFPKLTPHQIDKIVNKVNGNPGFLHDLLDYLEKEEELFIEEELSNPLTEFGEEELEKILLFSHYELNSERFKRLEKDIKKLLSWSSYQGINFLEPLTIEIAQMIDESIEGETSLQRANKHFCMIEKLEKYLSEFSQSAIYEIAKSKIKNYNYHQFNKAFVTILKVWFKTQKYKKFSLTEQIKFLLLLKEELSGNKKKEDRAVFVSIILELSTV